MDSANISTLKRRLKGALGECKSHASVTARRLVGQISHKIEQPAGCDRRQSFIASAAQVTRRPHSSMLASQWRRTHRHWQRGKRAIATAASSTSLSATNGNSNGSQFNYMFELSAAGSAQMRRCVSGASDDFDAADDFYVDVDDGGGGGDDYDDDEEDDDDDEVYGTVNINAEQQVRGGRCKAVASHLSARRATQRRVGDGDGAQLSLTATQLLAYNKLDSDSDEHWTAAKQYQQSSGAMESTTKTTATTSAMAKTIINEDLGWGSDFDDDEDDVDVDGEHETGTNATQMDEEEAAETVGCCRKGDANVENDDGKDGDKNEEDGMNEEEEDDEDDEAELRSFEARQGFRQIRDKLKVILDKRLASYEQQSSQEPTDGQAVAATTTKELSRGCSESTAAEAKVRDSTGKVVIIDCENVASHIDNSDCSERDNDASNSTDCCKGKSVTKTACQQQRHRLEPDETPAKTTTTTTKRSSSKLELSVDGDDEQLSGERRQRCRSTTQNDKDSDKDNATRVRRVETNYTYQNENNRSDLVDLNSKSKSVVCADEDEDDDDDNSCDSKRESKCVVVEFDCQSQCSDDEVAVDDDDDDDDDCGASSTASSSGLDSNHSGSQDSGHSTQHSGYSAIGQVGGRGVGASSAGRLTTAPQSSPQRRRQPSRSGAHQVSGVGGGGGNRCAGSCATSSSGSDAGVGSLSPTTSATPPATDIGEQMCSNSLVAPLTPPQARQQDNHPVVSEQRERFLKNRLLINSKLESMLKSRQASCNNNAAPTTTKAISTASKTIGSKSIGDLRIALGAKLAKGAPPPMLPNCTMDPRARISNNADAEQQVRAKETTTREHEQQVSNSSSREQLLEQQRQILLKLKQKPRNKQRAGSSNNLQRQQQQYQHQANVYNLADANERCAKMAAHEIGSYRQSSSEWHLPTSASSAAAATSSGARHAQVPVPPPMPPPLPAGLIVSQRQQSKSARNLSESVVEDKFSANKQQRVHLESNAIAQTPQNAQQIKAVAPRAAQSLRQLVKEVIDDCEKPNRLSTLTRNMLTRSDSLSTASDNDADDTSNQVAETSAGNRLIIESTQSTPRKKYDQTSASANTSASMSIQRASSESFIVAANEHSNWFCHQQQQQQQVPPSPTGVRPIDLRQQLCSVAGAMSADINHQLQSSTPQRMNRTLSTDDSVSMSLDPNEGSIRLTGCSMIVDSSLGSTIDGLELGASMISSMGPQLSGSTTANDGNKVNANGQHAIGAYWKGLRDFSRSKLQKVKLIGQNLNTNLATANTTNSNANPSSSSQQQQRHYNNTNNNNGNNPVGCVNSHTQQHSKTLAGAWRRQTKANGNRKRASVVDLSPTAMAMGSRLSVNNNNNNSNGYNLNSNHIIETGNSNNGYQNTHTSMGNSNAKTGGGFANHFVTISNRKWKSCHLRASLMQLSAFNNHQVPVCDPIPSTQRQSVDHNSHHNFHHLSSQATFDEPIATNKFLASCARANNNINTNTNCLSQQQQQIFSAYYASAATARNLLSATTNLMTPPSKTNQSNRFLNHQQPKSHSSQVSSTPTNTTQTSDAKSLAYLDNTRNFFTDDDD